MMNEINCMYLCIYFYKRFEAFSQFIISIINMIYITIIYNIHLYSHYIYVFTISIPYKEIIYL